MSNAASKFADQLKHVDQLIEIHGKLQSGRGRRHEQDALHRAGVVMTVAAWQSYVESVIREALDVLNGSFNQQGAQAPAWAIHGFKIQRAAIEVMIKKFNTPSAVNVRDIFRDSLGFNPWPHWTYRRGPRTWTEREVRKRTDDWVLVRHSVAHGFALPRDIGWLQGRNGQSRLNLDLLRKCKKHFEHVVQVTDGAFGSFIGAEHQLPAPW